MGAVVELITIDGITYSPDELEELLGIDRLDPPYDTAELQALIDEANDESSSALAELVGALLLLALIPGLPRDRIVYAVRPESYYQGRRPIPQHQLGARVFADAQQTATRLQRLTDDLTAGRISLEQWQRQVGGAMLRGQMRMAQGGAGTAGRLTPRHLEALRQRLRDELGAVADVADRIARGDISEKMLRYRAGKWGYNTGAAFWEAQHIAHSDGRWLARRVLGGNVNHCEDCIDLQSPEWRPAEDVTPPGVDCRCRGRCLCQIAYRPVTLSDRLPIG